MCTAGATYAPVGRAIAGRREQVFLQVHFGAVYDENGEYGWCRDFETIKKTFLWELEQLGTDYVDFGFLHCVDEDADFDKLIEIGVLDYLKELKAQGIVRHIGFSSHTPSVANRIIDTGLIDMMMFSINPAYDFEKGDEYGIGSVKERLARKEAELKAFAEARARKDAKRNDLTALISSALGFIAKWYPELGLTEGDWSDEDIAAIANLVLPLLDIEIMKSTSKRAKKAEAEK